MEIKIQCSCGSRYKFDVEPVNGQAPTALECPNCHVSWTEHVNTMIAQSQAAAVAPMMASVSHAPAIGATIAPAAVTPPAATSPRIALRLSGQAPRETSAQAADTTPAETPAPAPASTGRPIPRVVTLDPLLEQRQSMGNFGLGVLGAVGGSLLGGGLYYVLFIHTGFRVKLVALAVGVLAALGAKLLSKDRSKELGGIVALLAIASIVGAQYLVAQQWFKAEDTTAPQKSNYEERVGEARKVLEAVPNGTDQEIRLYLAKEQAEDGEKPDPKSIGRDEIKDFRENGLPHYRDLANGKISKEEFDKENDVTLSAEDRQKEQKENERTFQWVFLALTLSKFNIVCLIGAAGIAYRMTADA